MASRYGYGRARARYEDEENRYDREQERSRSEDYEIDRDRYRPEGAARDREQRGFWDRASDEVSSWFGDEEAERRRSLDERQDVPRNYRRRTYERQPSRTKRGYSRTSGYDREGYQDYHSPTRQEDRYTGGYGQGYYGGFGREGRMFGTGGREYDRSYSALDDIPGYYGSESEAHEGYGGSEWTRRGAYSEGMARRGPYTGRGPRGYQRSDERIREEVNERLMRHGEIDAAEIEVTVNSGEVTLSGSVDSRRSKHLAEDVAEDVMGVNDVLNQLRVTRSSWNQPGQEKRES